MELMLPPKASRKAPMLPGPVEMKMRIVAPRVVPDPSAIGMNVGRIGVPRHVGESPAFQFATVFRDAVLWHARGSRGRPVGRNESATGTATGTPAAPLL